MIIMDKFKHSSALRYYFYLNNFFLLFIFNVDHPSINLQNDKVKLFPLCKLPVSAKLNI